MSRDYPTGAMLRLFEEYLGQEPPLLTRNALAQVAYERQHQDRKWPKQATDPNTPWLGILTEEVGEVARATLDNAEDGPQDLRSELIQVAAVAVAWVEWLDRISLKREDDDQRQ